MKHIQYNRSVFFVSTLIYVCFILTTISFVDINSNSVASGTYYLWPICAISGIVFINNTFLYMQKIINKIRILHYVGLHSMSFYTSHWVVIMSSLLLYNNILGLDKIWTLLCTVFSCITVLPFISNLKVSRYNVYIRFT